jgi:thiosulfate dehydrogenase
MGLATAVNRSGRTPDLLGRQVAGNVAAHLFIRNRRAKGRMYSRFHTIVLLAVTSTIPMTACGGGSDRAPSTATGRDTAAVVAPQRAAFRIPSESEITDSVTLASVRRGRALIHATRDSLPNHVRASLSCANCHIADGTQRDAMPLVGSYARFPQYRGRSAKVDLIEDRINDCFQRSMNGTALPANSSAMRDMVAYLAFLSRGFPVGVEMEGQGVPAIPAMKGDTARGRAVFASTCVVCHGADGQGTVAAPPLWGPKSFNIGAGMARVNSVARFVHALMPRDRPGTLTPQQAFDVASFIISRPRPDFPGKENDWPRGGAPPDVAYPTRAAARAAEAPPGN